MKNAEQKRQMVEKRECPICNAKLNASCSYAGTTYLKCERHEDHQFSLEWNINWGNLPEWVNEGVAYSQQKNADAFRHFPQSAKSFAKRAIDPTSIQDTPADFISHLEHMKKEGK